MLIPIIIYYYSHALKYGITLPVVRKGSVVSRVSGLGWPLNCIFELLYAQTEQKTLL